MIKMLRLFVLACSLITLIFIHESDAKSAIDEVSEGDLEFLSSQSNLIFLGEVTDISYRISRSDAEGTVPLPFTFVTHKISLLLHGSTPADSFTMRLIGGPNENGQFLTVTGVPNFQVGQQDLLFVSGNGSEGCPLVLCESGRYRISEGHVYNSNGYPIQLFEQNRAIAGGKPKEEFMAFEYPTPSFDTLLRGSTFQRWLEESQFSIAEIRSLYDENVGDTILSTSVIALPDEYVDESDGVVITTNDPDTPGVPDTQISSVVAVDVFVQKLRTVLATAGRPFFPLSGIEKDAPFSFFSPAESDAPLFVDDPSGGSSDGTSQSPEDLEELRILQRQGFNPVIKE